MADLDQQWYSVRKGWRPGVYSTVDKMLPAVLGYPDAEFDVFPTLAAADQYLCSYLEVARFVTPAPAADECFLATAVATAGSTAEPVAAGVGVCVNSGKHPDLNKCAMLKGGQPRRLVEIQAVTAVVDSLAATGKKWSVFMLMSDFAEKLMGRVYEKYCKLANEPDAAARVEIDDDNDAAAEFKPHLGEIETLFKKVASNPLITIVADQREYSARSGLFAARMALYLAAKAASTGARVYQPAPAKESP